MNADPKPSRPGREEETAREALLDPMEWAKRKGAFPDVMTEMNSYLARRRRHRRLGAAGAVLALLALVFVGWERWPRSGPAEQAPPVTLAAVAGRSNWTLPDGSQVDVRVGGRIQTVYTDAVRKVILEEGDAHFQVVKDPLRPFVVTVGDIEVRAVGTAFTVQRGASLVEVIVTEGRVRVASRAEASPAVSDGKKEESLTLADLSVGTSAVMEWASRGQPPSVQIEKISEEKMASLHTWRVPLLEFNNTPLSEVLGRVNPYLKAKLVSDDGRLQNVRLSGRLQADNVETLLRVLEEDHGVRVVRRDAAEIVLRSGR